MPDRTNPVAKPSDLYARGGKYVFDLLLILLSLPFLLPVFAILIVVASLDGASPFYIHPRVGKNGKAFHCFKFRSMVPDADKKLKDLLDNAPEARSEWEHYQKIKNDPRVTKFGRFLRSSSLDELPQLFNVLRGEMSLVGPRPFMPNQNKLYKQAGGGHYYDLKPGITGAWQVSSRNSSSFKSRTDYDDLYYQNMSLSEDVRILAKTISVVLKRTGH
ncbi:MAG: exopolysaccharide biosynthesis protein [Rhodobacterales bacterium]|nr:MAG: exopolysaccharide biosynthesis protein [Rhodobacterales bacterium]